MSKLICMSMSVAVTSGLATAGDIFLDFEGLQDLEGIASFYDGGAGSFGSTGGTDFGVQFLGDALAIIDADAGGTGNFGDEPSPDTIMFFPNANSAVMNVAAGFDTGFGIEYTSVSQTGGIEIWSGLNGTGTLLASLSLPPLGAGSGDPNGDFSNWDRAELTFAGTAQSVRFTGSADQIGFDDASFGTTTFVVPLPPAAWGGLAMLGGLGVARRIRQ